MKRIPREEGAAFLAKLAGMREHGEMARSLLSANKIPLLGAAITGAALGIANYHAAKPDSSGLSGEQRGSRELLAAHEKEEAESPESHGLPFGMAGVGLRATKAMADLQAKHPVASGITTGLAGASVGWKLLPKLVELLSA